MYGTLTDKQTNLMNLYFNTYIYTVHVTATCAARSYKSRYMYYMCSSNINCFALL